MGRVSDAKERLMAAVSELFWTGSYDGTTIDQICQKAGVRKGSFYYFFDCKASLAEASLEQEWSAYRPKLDAIYSASLPPLERIRQHCEFSIEEQQELQKQHGCVLGCPLCTLGTEVSTQEKGLQKKIQEIMAYGLRYLETAIRDAHASGDIKAPDAKTKAKVVHAYHLGIMTQARIQNDLSVLEDLIETTFELLGVPVPRKPKKRTGK